MTGAGYLKVLIKLTCNVPMLADAPSADYTGFLRCVRARLRPPSFPSFPLILQSACPDSTYPNHPTQTTAEDHELEDVACCIQYVQEPAVATKRRSNGKEPPSKRLRYHAESQKVREPSARITAQIELQRHIVHPRWRRRREDRAKHLRSTQGCRLPQLRVR